jgi:hypothetical protein
MPEQKPEIEGVSVVLVGALNPAIFQPAWFAGEKLIRQEEADKADVKVISPQVSVFSIGWVNLEVTLDRFNANTTQIQHLDSVRDLIAGTFTLLRHTPIKHVGINPLAHFRSKSVDDWHKIGHRLAPKEPWAGLLEKPGMRRVSMLGQRTDDYKGDITATVEPSLVLSQTGFGVYFEVNDHYDISNGEGNDCDRMAAILKNCWEPSLERASRIMQQLITYQ